jgi:polyisoprenoid-binding protein YceI
LLLLFTPFCFAQAKHIPTKSTVTFQIKNLGINVGGSFSGFKGDLQFDPSRLDSSRIEASVDAKTINTDNDGRDEHLRSDSYFDVDKYPQITLKSVSFRHKSGNNYSGVFNLTIKDKTRQVELPFTYTENGGAASFRGNLKIQRTDYGVGGTSLVMADDVSISINVDTTR